LTATDPRGASPARLGAALALLSFAAGTMDAIAFLALGGIFTSAMSGNTIVLGTALGQGKLGTASRTLVAFAGYVCGAAGAPLPLRAPGRGIRRTLGLELLLLAAFAVWWICGSPEDPSDAYGFIILSALAMGLQGGIGRAMHVAGVPTIVITSTLTAIIESVAERALARQRPLASTTARQQISAVLAYLVGAVTGGVMVWAEWLAALPFVPLAAVLALWLALRMGFVRLEPNWAGG
jgi:uncharacterized membrane protein YoaK (UPF0700 family)